MKIQCPACDVMFNIPDDSQTGEVVNCADCGESYELDKDMNLKLAETMGEDWGQ